MLGPGLVAGGLGAWPRGWWLVLVVRAGAPIMLMLTYLLTILYYTILTILTLLTLPDRKRFLIPNGSGRETRPRDKAS